MMKKLFALCLLAALAACAKPAAAPKAANTPPDHPAMGETGHAAATTSQALKGTVLETINAGGFTYVRLKTATGERWMVTSPVDVKVGAEVSVSSGMVVEKFESKSLKRTFDNVVFGSIDGVPTASTHVPASAAKEIGDVKVEKAEGAGAKTIAEIWSSKAALKDHKVVVRGKIVKFLPSIMGKNWMHVRDGSGTRGKGDDDIAVISDDQATVGSVVTLTGTVRLDKDFGAGYQYPVIIEDAKLR